MISLSYPPQLTLFSKDNPRFLSSVINNDTTVEGNGKKT